MSFTFQFVLFFPMLCCYFCCGHALRLHASGTFVAPHMAPLFFSLPHTQHLPRLLCLHQAAPLGRQTERHPLPSNLSMRYLTPGLSAIPYSTRLFWDGLAASSPLHPSPLPAFPTMVPQNLSGCLRQGGQEGRLTSSLHSAARAATIILSGCSLPLNTLAPPTTTLRRAARHAARALYSLLSPSLHSSLPSTKLGTLNACQAGATAGAGLWHPSTAPALFDGGRTGSAGTGHWFHLPTIPQATGACPAAITLPPSCAPSPWHSARVGDTFRTRMKTPLARRHVSRAHLSQHISRQLRQHANRHSQAL